MKKIMKIRKLVKHKCLYLLLVVFLFSHHSFAQLVFYQDVFYGGVTGGGFSTGLGAGSGTINLHIEPSSTIKKAFLICQRFQNPPPAYITVNSIPYLLDASNELTSYMIVTHSQKSGVHVVDITSDINPNQNTYFITIPSQTGDPERAYNVVYLLILYENSTLPKSTINVVLNNQNLEDSNNKFYLINNINPINPNFPVGFALNTDRIRNPTIFNDGSHVFFNSVLLGLIGGIDANSIATGGIQGHFYYQNNTLFGLDDDTPDSLMAGTDGLADVSSYISNNSTSYNFNLRWQDLMATSRYNIYNSFFVTYTTPCDTFSTSTNSNVDTICQGESIQLNATGGVEYSWFSAFSTFNDSTLANPIASPTQTTTYIVTIKNDSGCVKTEHVKVWVNPAPKPDTTVIIPQRCGSANGSITVGNIPNGTTPFNYELTNLQTLVTSNQQLATFNNLLAGNYLITITDSNGCQWRSDTLVVSEINDITANFSVYALPVVIPTPNPLGTAPLTVYTQNSSVNATSFEWWVVSDVLGIRDTIEQIPASAGVTTPSFNFDSGGTFEICLLAYNNIPTCGDTVCKTIVIAPAPDSLVLIVPNVFSPNADGSNDNFVLQVQSANLLEKIEVEIFNRWGMIVESREFKMESTLPTTHYTLWDGTTTTGTEVPEGTYFYVINYTKVTGETESLKGTITLLR